MEFRIERAVLADAVTWAARSLPARSPVPVLSGLLLEAAEGRLRISGFDYEASATVEVDAETAESGRVLVLGRRLQDICRVLPDVPLSCRLEGTRFAVEGGGTCFGLSTLPLQEYPKLPQPPAVYGELGVQQFADAVAQVVVAAGRDDTLPVLTGVQLRLDADGTLTLGASDRYRYAIRGLPWKPGGEWHGTETGAAEVVVPGRRLAEVAKGLGRASTPLWLGLDQAGGLISLEAGGKRATLRLLEGRLPRHEKLFTLDDAVVARVDRDPLMDAVRRVAVVAEPNSPVRLDFSADGAVRLQAGYEDDVASQTVPISAPGATSASVAFNPDFLLDALSSFTAPWVEFALLGAGQRALLSASPTPDRTTAGQSEHRHLLMSVRQLS